MLLAAITVGLTCIQTAGPPRVDTIGSPLQTPARSIRPAAKQADAPRERCRQQSWPWIGARATRFPALHRKGLAAPSAARSSCGPSRPQRRQYIEGPIIRSIASLIIHAHTSHASLCVLRHHPSPQNHQRSAAALSWARSRSSQTALAWHLTSVVVGLIREMAPAFRGSRHPVSIA
jgi:hypothetical protein